jgi:RNA polymerase sigma-70 factor (ECF subfamily)
MTNLSLVHHFESNRQHLRAVAYRMLGSIVEAEDAVQECWFRLSRSDADAINDYKGWLTVVVSRLCLDMLRSRKVLREASLEDYAHPVRPTQQASQEQEMLLADSVGIGLLVMLDRLSPRERVAYVLHDLFGFSFGEISDLLGASSASARQLASRARRRIRGVEQSQAPRSAQHRKVVSRFLSALRSGDVEELIAVLDPNLKVTIDRNALPPGSPDVVRGARNWASQAIAFSRQISHIRAAVVDGHMGVILAPNGHLSRVLRLRIEGDKINEIEIVADARRLERLTLVVEFDEEL